MYNEGYVFTHHLRERFVQRTRKKYEHLQQCREEKCRICDSLIKQSKIEVSESIELIDAEMNKRISLSDENRSYLNNSEFMSAHYEKYGYDKRFKFLVHKDILFVVVEENDGSKIVVTCLMAATHIAGRPSFRPKYKFWNKKKQIQHSFN